MGVVEGPRHVTDEKTSPTIDRPTLVAIAVVVYALANVSHEGLGHGGACLLVGGEPRLLDAAFFNCGEDALSLSSRAWIAAAGTLVNLALAALAGLGLALAGRKPTTGRYLLWLLMTVNLCQGTGYWLFSGVGGIGDWKVVAEAAAPGFAGRIALAVAGALGYAGAIVLALRTLSSFLGADGLRRKRGWVLTLVPYFAGGLLYVGAGSLNPEGPVIVAISAAAASLGGTSALAWMATLLDRVPPAGERPFVLERSVPWLAVGGLVALVFIGVLGPGLHL
jgi:hypothetical protein